MEACNEYHPYKKLCFHYEAGIEENALRDVSLDIIRGECLVLTGESGCGKTTLTRCLNGLIPDFFEGRLTGNIYYEEKLLSEMEQHEISTHIGTVFQDPRSQFFTVNSTDELAFGCENLGFSTERINQNVTAAFGRLHMDELKDRSLFKLSSGEKQKLAVASVYAMDPDVIILDEPTANLDRETIKTLREMLFALKQQGKTLIVSEHRLSWLDGLADRYVYMTDGEIGQVWNAKAARSLSPEALQHYGLRCIQDPSPPKYQQMKKYSNAMNEIEGAGLSVSFEKHTVIKDLNFHFTWGSDGKVIGIVGENGSGKTTFSKMLCGLLKPVSGEILLNGKLCNQNERVKKTYFVMQDADYQLFTESVAHEIELASHKNVSTKEKLSTVEMNRILQKFYLTNFSDCHPLSLSGGQKQRVTIASAIAAMPDILVMDEPTSGLDGKNMLRLKNIISDLKQQGKLIFIVTHDEEFLDGLADEIMTFSPAGEY
ncbi:MAG: ABC transporter ATP-binding protein [Lachnospiraceae bacterium]